MIFTVGGKTVYHPREIAEAAASLVYPTDFIGRANSIAVPIGPEPGVAFVLMIRKDVTALVSAGAAVTIHWKDGFSDLTFENWYIVRASVVCPAEDDDDKAFMLVELQDKRRICKMSCPAAAGPYYNWRSWAKFGTNDAGTYASDTINSGTAWTWQEVLDDLWGELPSGLTLGTSPTLPYSPTGKPENITCDGYSPWELYHELLKSIDCALLYNPVEDEFSIIQLGTTQEELSQTIDELHKKGRMEFDYSPQVPASSHIPEKVLICFQSRDQDAGGGGSQITAADTANGRIWAARTFRTYLKTTGVSGAIAGTVLPIYDVLVGDYTEGGTLITDLIDLDARADELRDNFVARLQTSNARMKRIFSGLVDTILPGSEVKVVSWSDFGDSDGPQTEIFNTADSTVPNDILPDPRLPAIRASRQQFPPIGAPWTAPETVIVLTDADAEPNGDGYISGTLYFLAGTTQQSYPTGAKACWIKVQPNPEVTAPRLVAEAYYFGKVAGIITSDASVRPLIWVVSPASSKARWINFELTTELTTADETATADVVFYADGADPDPDDDGLTVYNRLRSDGAYEYHGHAGDEYTTGALGYALYHPGLDRYYIIDLECVLA